MKIKELIKELQNYDENLESLFMLVEDEHDSTKDIPIKWVGEIDTSMIEDAKRIEFGFLRISMTEEEEYKNAGFVKGTK